MSRGEIFPYPTGVLRVLMQLPVLFYRLGLARALRFLPVMILITRGRRTGLPRPTPVEFRTHGSKIYVISGWGQRPEWFKNLTAHPDVTVQIGPERLAARAKLVENEGEAQRALSLFRRNAPWYYDIVFARITGTSGLTQRAVPDLSSAFTIVRLDRLPDAPLPLRPVPPDLAWIVQMGMFASAMTLALMVFARTRRS